MSEVIDIFRNVRHTTEYKASLVREKSDLELKRWELGQELEAIQSRIEKIEEEL